MGTRNYFLVVFLTICTGVSIAGGPIWYQTFNKVNKSDDETITIRYKDRNNVTHTLVAKTGEQGTNHQDDDLPKGMSGVEKAARIVDAINHAEGNEGNVVAEQVKVGGNPTNLVAVYTPDPNKGIVRVKPPNHTRQRGNGDMVGKENWKDGEHVESYFYLMGVTAGRNDDEEPSEIEVGTSDYTSVMHPEPNVPTEDLARQIVHDLVEHGVSASLVLPSVIRIVLREDDSTVYGGDDVGVYMWVDSRLVE